MFSLEMCPVMHPAYYPLYPAFTMLLDRFNQSKLSFPLRGVDSEAWGTKALGRAEGFRPLRTDLFTLHPVSLQNLIGNQHNPWNDRLESV